MTGHTIMFGNYNRNNRFKDLLFYFIWLKKGGTSPDVYVLSAAAPWTAAHPLLQLCSSATSTWMDPVWKPPTHQVPASSCTQCSALELCWLYLETEAPAGLVEARAACGVPSCTQPEERRAGCPGGFHPGWCSPPLQICHKSAHFLLSKMAKPSDLLPGAMQGPPP